MFVLENLPSLPSTTTTSIAPLRVAGFIEFHVFDTEPEIERTYCIDAQADFAVFLKMMKSMQSLEFVQSAYE